MNTAETETDKDLRELSYFMDLDGLTESELYELGERMAIILADAPEDRTGAARATAEGWAGV